MAVAETPIPPMGLKADSLWGKLSMRTVPQKYLMISAFISYLILGIAYLQNAPIWLAFGLALMPWGLIVAFELEWTYKHFGWFALFLLVGFVQLIHYSEHCIQVIQIHFFGDSPHNSQAIFGTLNSEWVHFTGDTFLTIATLVLLKKFPRNPWLWIAVPFQILHQAEHTFIMTGYLFQGYPAGGPGLLASPNGAIFGGIGLARADLHWIYNTLYTIPLVLALVWELKRTYDESLDVAFPDAPRAELRAASRHLETFRYAPSETVLAPGDDAARLYIITEGEATVCQVEDGREVPIATLHRGQYFGEIGLLVANAAHTKVIRAATDLVVLAMDEETFRHLMAVSQVTQGELVDVAMSRVSPAALPAQA
jgi:Cyclic nucleotide-binding domain